MLPELAERLNEASEGVEDLEHLINWGAKKISASLPTIMRESQTVISAAAKINDSIYLVIQFIKRYSL